MYIFAAEVILYRSLLFRLLLLYLVFIDLFIHVNSRGLVHVLQCSSLHVGHQTNITFRPFTTGG